MPPSISIPTDMNNNTTKASTLSSDFTEKQTETGRKTAPTVSCSLKRKRPPGIEIPNVLRELRTDASLLPLGGDSNPPEDAVCSSGFGFGFGFGVFSAKGKKKFMEDTHKIVSFSKDKGFFGVYDGHGGRKAADFVAQNLHNNIFEMLENFTAKEDAIKAGYLKTDQEFLKQGLGSGTCCVTALIEGEEIVISNLGDCRAVLCRDGIAEALTKDHRAGQEDERKRIEDKGGYVEVHRGAWRVHGILSVSRSIGDAHLKDWVPAEPETTILHLSPEMEYLVLASDGLWEQVGNQEAVDIVRHSCLVGKKQVPTGDIRKENHSEFGCVKASPPSKLRRVALIKQNRRIGLSPNYKKTVAGVKESEDFGSENEVPPTKARRISWKESDDFTSENESPLTKSRKISAKARRISWKESDNFGSENEVPPTEARRISWKESDDCTSENESPLTKSQRISPVDQMNMNVPSPDQENCAYKKKPAFDGLVATCKELVNLAVARGSLDDITVMIIDLNCFR